MAGILSFLSSLRAHQLTIHAEQLLVTIASLFTSMAGKIPFLDGEMSFKQRPALPGEGQGTVALEAGRVDAKSEPALASTSHLFSRLDVAILAIISHNTFFML